MGEPGGESVKERVRPVLPSLIAREVSKATDNPPPKALQVVGELRVIRISRAPLDEWVVLGDTGDYLVLPRLYCSCPHYMINVATGRTVKPCYHLVAVELAKSLNRFIDLSEMLTRDTLVELVFEVLVSQRSKTLRQLLMRAREASSYRPPSPLEG